ncbi:MAG: hypothetical protein GKB99_04455 [Methanocellales archaeon]|nr:hypothetical protein [Methanocellales archaeon]
MNPEKKVNGDIEKMFLRAKPARILLAIAKQDEDSYASIISKEVDATYAHTTSVLSEMEHYGLISFRQEGRVKYIGLTDLGNKIAKSLRVLLDIFDGIEVFPEFEEVKELQEKITSLRSRVEGIYKDELSGRKNLSLSESTRISRRFGPYCRELRKIDKINIQNEELKRDFYKLKKRIEELMLLKDKLKS